MDKAFESRKYMKCGVPEVAVPFYFDVLPLHPQPEHFESLTSYLMRLAEVNNILSVDGISSLCFPNQDRRIARGIADYLPVSLDNLTVASACTEEILRITTFFHLVAKFGRSTLPQPTSRFLTGCLGQYLRYCPMCFAEQRIQYYLISWRFLILTCCVRHKCSLLETCGHCNGLIPIFTAPFKLSYCPICQRNLMPCSTTLVTDEAELEMVTQVQDDISFLLTPQPWELNSEKIIKHVGRRLAHIRQTKHITAQELASQIGVTLTVIEGIERGDFQGRGATLQSYFKYAHHLCLSLKEVFSDAIGSLDHASVATLPFCPTCQQSYYVTRNGYNRSGSQRYQCQQCHCGFTT